MQNYIPANPSNYRLALIGEGPSHDDKSRGQPFSGDSGTLLCAALSTQGIPRDKLFLGYVSDRRGSKYDPLSPSHQCVIDTSNQLAIDLNKFNPHCCLVMGTLANKVFGYEHSIYSARGSIYHSVQFNRKCVATYDHAEIYRNPVWTFPFKLDINRAKEQSLFPGINSPHHQLTTWPSAATVICELQNILDTKPKISFDLEGHPNQIGVTCYSIATSPTNAFIVPFRNMDGTPFFSLDEEVAIWRLTSAILSDSDILKTCQNGMYELFVFAWRHKIFIRGLSDDTLYQMWELYCEQPKDLAFISSLFTETPYYKADRVVPDLHTHHEYCCKDSVVTYESEEKMTKLLARHKPSLDHYRFNISLQRPYLYMQLRGCRIDTDLMNAKREEVWSKIQVQQEIVNHMTNRTFNVKSPIQKAQYLYGDLGLPEQYKFVAGKKEVTTDFGALCSLVIQSGLPVVLEIAKLTRLRTRFSDINKLVPFPDGRIRSNYNPVGTDTGRLSSSETWVEDYVTLPKIEFKTRSKNKIKYQEMNLVQKSIFTNLGTNLQNVTKDLRDLFIPDSDDFLFFQYDLSGADAWTVAADLAALGNDRMLVHLQRKIKPSVVIVLLIEHGPQVYKWDLDHLKQVHDATLKQIKTTPRLAKAYTCAKGCQHGTNYGMEAPLMAAVQLERSIAGWIDDFNNGGDSPIDFAAVHPYIMESYQNQYISYYGIELRNEYIRKQLTNFGYTDSATGHRRHFQSIRNRRNVDDKAVRTAAAHEPQANTTWATNKALARMYYDTANRTQRGYLRCEPLLMVHDALEGQAHKSQVAWATEKISEWFNNPLLIHGLEITIPVEGGWGTSWKATD